MPTAMPFPRQAARAGEALHRAIAFPDVEKLKGQRARETRRLSQAGIIRVIGLLAVMKDQKGDYDGVQVTKISDGDRMKLGAGIAALIGYGAGGIQGAEAGAVPGLRC